MLQLLIVLIIIVSPSTILAASCTDGTDCYEDCRRNTDGAGNDVGSYANTGCQTAGIVKATVSNLVVIEDSENTDYYSNTSATSDSWVDNGGTSGYRGGGSAWLDKYIGVTNGCLWTSGQPSASPTVGDQCGFSACGPIEYRPDNLWQSHLANTCIDIQAAGEVDAEGYGLTLSDNHYGSHWLGGRVPAGRCADRAAEAISFSGGSSVYFVAAIAYSTNLVDDDVHVGASCPSTGSTTDFVPRPWKHFEWGDTNQFGFGAYQNFAFMGAAVGTDTYSADAPFSLFLNMTHGSSGSSCQSAANAAITKGAATCHVESGDADFFYYGPTSNFDRTDDWPLGTWALVRGEVSGLGTASCDLHIWFWHESDGSETQIFAMDNFDCATYIADIDLSPVWINWYYNGGQPGCEGTGPCTTTEPIFIYYDFFEVGKGSAPSAADVGWETALGAAGGGSTPTRGSPSGQFTIGDALREADAVLLAAPW